MAIALWLASCSSPDFSQEDLLKARQEAQAPASALAPMDNAAIRYKSLAEKATAFPDHLNAGDQIFLSGWPKRAAHFTQWLEQNRPILEALDKTVLIPGYALRVDDLDDPERPDRMMRLAYLLLVEAASQDAQNRPHVAIRRCLQALRMASALASDGLLVDAKLAHLIQQRAYHLFNRVAPRVAERELQESIVELRRDVLALPGASRAQGRMRRFAPLRILQWLAPDPADSMTERMGLPSRQALEGTCQRILDSQESLMSRPVGELLRAKAWSEFSSQWKGASEFTDDYFVLGSGYPAGLQFQLIESWMRMRLELMQLHAGVLIFARFNQKTWPASMQELRDNVILCQVTLGKLESGAPGNQLKDPFSGGDYGFRAEEGNLLLWCVGPDLEDNAGLEPWDDTQGRGDFILDIRKPS